MILDLEIVGDEEGKYSPLSELPFSFASSFSSTSKIEKRLGYIQHSLPVNNNFNCIDWIAHRSGYAVAFGPDSGFGIDDFEENIVFMISLTERKEHYDRLKSLDPGWLISKEMKIAGCSYKPQYFFSILLNDSKGFVYLIYFSPENLKKPITTENHLFELFDRLYSAKSFNSRTTAEIDDFFSDIFNLDFDWKNENREYNEPWSDNLPDGISMKLNIYAKIHLPYTYLQEIDNNPHDMTKILNFVDDLVEEMCGCYLV